METREKPLAEASLYHNYIIDSDQNLNWFFFLILTCHIINTKNEIQVTNEIKSQQSSLFPKNHISIHIKTRQKHHTTNLYNPCNIVYTSAFDANPRSVSTYGLISERTSQQILCLHLKIYILSTGKY